LPNIIHGQSSKTPIVLLKSPYRLIGSLFMLISVIETLILGSEAAKKAIFIKNNNGIKCKKVFFSYKFVEKIRNFYFLP